MDLTPPTQACVFFLGEPIERVVALVNGSLAGAWCAPTALR